ncbi:hypothetical protein BOTBODRAFT_170220 [Botryobasidium botryosum FD-172 SS1]|uniref:Uncharacterized protein n=1 Tax=Botryobasidium botryosum (strain FD-172 SS1) TaxID=930990 RepID=A0A067N8W5_BOTB1|nr:hypothetical protein BOTBODRAFT_170220 [Botryobasidium botryosum FD-172 SS1]
MSSEKAYARKETAHDIAYAPFVNPSRGSSTSASETSTPRSKPSSTTLPAADPFFHPYTGAVQGFLGSPIVSTAPTPAPSPPAPGSPQAVSPGGSTSGQPKSSSSAPPDPYTVSDQQSNAIWAELSKIRVLQGEIARLHIAMDGPGCMSGKMKSGKSKRDSKDGFGSSQGPDPSPVPPAEADGDHEFAARREAIGTIMEKLDALSEAVTSFHSLPGPEIKFTARSSTLSFASPNTTPVTLPTPSSSSPGSVPTPTIRTHLRTSSSPQTTGHLSTPALPATLYATRLSTILDDDDGEAVPSPLSGYNVGADKM